MPKGNLSNGVCILSSALTKGKLETQANYVLKPAQLHQRRYFHSFHCPLLSSWNNTSCRRVHGIPLSCAPSEKTLFFQTISNSTVGTKIFYSKKKASQLRFSKDLQHAVHCCGNVSQPTSQPWLIQSAVTRRKMNVREVVMKLTLCLSKGSCHTMTHGLSYPCVKFPQDG